MPAVAQFGPFLGQCIHKNNVGVLASIVDGKLDSASPHALYDIIGPMLEALKTIESTAATEMLHQALTRCYTPRNTSLEDQTVFNEWFNQYPGDMYILGVKAIHRLLRDFFTSPLVIKTSGLLMNKTEPSTMAASQ